MSVILNFFGNEKIGRECSVKNDIGYIVSTVYTFDAGYETAILWATFEEMKEWFGEMEEYETLTLEDVEFYLNESNLEHIEVVENYSSRTKAMKGHEKWLKMGI